MTDDEMIATLNKAAKLLNSVYHEARSRYGGSAQIFFDESGFFNVMSGDDDAGLSREDYLVVSSNVRAKVTGGAW